MPFTMRKFVALPVAMAIFLAGCAAIIVGVSGSAVASATSASATAAASPAMMCIDPRSERYVRRYHPSECAILGRSSQGTDCSCGGSMLKHLMWTHWGRPVASATGREETLHSPEANLPTRIVLSGLEHGRCGAVYTRLSEISKAVQEYEAFPRESHTLVLAECPRAAT